MWLIPLLGLAGCADPDPPPFVPAPEFAVQRVVPEGSLRLNQEITVMFTDEVDPLTVGTDTVRVLDADGTVVPGELRTGDRWVAFRPVPPRQADLRDGSFVPGGVYRLHVQGYPRRNGVRARNGRMLARGIVREFRVDPQEDDAADLFLAEHSDRPFYMQLPKDPEPVAAVGRPVLRLDYSVPVLPTSLQPGCYELLVLRVGENAPERLPPPRWVRLAESGESRLPPGLQGLPGSTVELMLPLPASGPLRPGDVVYVRGNPARPIRDHAGRPVGGDPDLRVPWRIVEDTDVAALAWLAEPGHLPGPDGKGPGLVVDGGGNAQPGCFVELGPGGPVWQADPGQPVELAAREIAADSWRIGPGALLRWRCPAGDAARLRVRGDVRIAGTLELVAQAPSRELQSGSVYGEAELASGASLLILCGGRFLLEPGGRVVFRGPGPAAPVAVVAHGGVVLQGSLPVQTVLGQVGRGRLRIQGSASDPVLVRMDLQPGVAGEQPQRVTAWTRWVRVPEGLPDELPVAWRGSGGELLEVQAAPPHPNRTGQPADVPLPRPRAVAPGDLVRCISGHLLRFRITMQVPAGPGPPPWIRDLRLIQRGTAPKPR